jgi:TatD DNase family protein
VIDSHTHLHICREDDAELVAAAVDAGVVKMLTVGTDEASSLLALEAASRFPGIVYAAVGRHPNSATGFDDAAYASLAEMAADPRCLAVGETGLDYYREGASKEDQERAFRAQISLARAVGKPVVIHTREADDDTLAILRAEAVGVKVILHCFSMASRIEECLESDDWWISFAGNVTYPRNSDLRAAALRVPAGRLLVETDAPFLTPVPFRGKPNTPALVVNTAQALAVERRVSYDELSGSVEQAAAAVFCW